MRNTWSVVQLDVRLPNDVAEEAEQVQRTDPDFLSRIIQYGLTRRSIYRRLRTLEAGERESAEAEAEPTIPSTGRRESTPAVIADSFLQP